MAWYFVYGVVYCSINEYFVLQKNTGVILSKPGVVLLTYYFVVQSSIGIVLSSIGVVLHNIGVVDCYIGVILKVQNNTTVVFFNLK